MLLTIITFFVILNILVFIHEFGHFITAKKLDMGVEEFGFGLPPRIWGKKFKGLLISINWLPFGGFVRLAGEDIPEGEHDVHISKTSKYFFARPKWQRAVVLLAGVFMNFALAVIIVSYIFTTGVLTPTETATGNVYITAIAGDSPALRAGLVEEDIVRSVNDTPITTTQQLSEVIGAHAGQEVTLRIDRRGEEKLLTITPRAQTPENEGPLGIQISDHLELKKYSLLEAPLQGLKWAVMISFEMLKALASLVFRLITFQRINGNEVSGPVGIAQATGDAIKVGFGRVLQLMGLLSLNLALFNVLPIPALDGGRLFFVLFEDILGKRIKTKVEAAAHQIGFIVLIGLVILVTIHDVFRIIKG